MIYFNTPRETVDRMLEDLPGDTAIGEFSGRDSGAAILKALESPGIDHVLPVASFAGTEYGDTRSLEDNHQRLVRRVRELYGSGKELYPLVYYSHPALWSTLNGRFTSLLIQEFGFYTPCIGCHAYFHLLRVPMALRLGKIIISGERESHDGKIKVNQLPQCLSSYRKVISRLGVELLIPLQKTRGGEEIEKILGWDWQEGKGHPGCVYSGNYRDLEGQALPTGEQVNGFLAGFLEPVLEKIGPLFLQDPEIDQGRLVKEASLILE